MNDAVVISESPQAGFYDGFISSHVSKIGGNTVIRLLGAVVEDRTRPSTTEHTDDAPIATLEMTRGLFRRTCHHRRRQHVARPSLTEKMHISPLLREFQNQVTR